jgi:hypothetical protein
MGYMRVTNFWLRKVYGFIKVKVLVVNVGCTSIWKVPRYVSEGSSSKVSSESCVGREG